MAPRGRLSDMSWCSRSQGAHPDGECYRIGRPRAYRCLRWLRATPPALADVLLAGANAPKTNACAIWLRRGGGLRRGSRARAATSARSAANPLVPQEGVPWTATAVAWAEQVHGRP
jgi:hypothetical protein